MSIGLIAAEIEAGMRWVARDPLLSLQAAHEQQGQLWGERREVLQFGGNRSAKTTGGAAKGIALARGLRTLGGVMLPPIQVPNVGWVIVKSRPQQVDAVQKVYRGLLGTMPHVIAWSDKARDYIDSIRVKPDSVTSDNPARWSVIRFHCEESESTIGGGIDWAHADEPPGAQTWREVRSRQQADRPLYLWITATPLERRDWYWITDEAWDTAGKIRLRDVSMRDNRFLSEAVKRELEERWNDDPQADARLYGWLVDTGGNCPYSYRALQALKQSCVRGEAWEKDSRLEVWYEPEVGEQYFVLWDPSSGIEDDGDAHSPSGLLVVARKRPAIVARFNGYTDPIELARFGAKVARHYNGALVVPEMNYSPEATAVGLEGYGNVYLETHEDRLAGTVQRRIGWRTTSANRGTIVASLQRALVEGAFECWSSEMIDNLMATQMDHNRKLVQGPGYHTEDAILMGIACHLLESQPVREAKDREERDPMVWLDRAMGMPPRRAVASMNRR